jgi:hypothetical protein
MIHYLIAIDLSLRQRKAIKAGFRQTEYRITENWCKDNNYLLHKPNFMACLHILKDYTTFARSIL